MLKLSTIVKALTHKTIPLLDASISSVVIDSRQAVEDSLFIALPGEQTDGHNFVRSAFEYGAKLAFVHQEMPDDLNIVDLRENSFDTKKSEFSLPLCLRVENTLEALHILAAFWRTEHPVRTIGITGSVGKTTTKELTAELLSKKYRVIKNPGNRNNEIGLPLTLLELEDQHQYAVLEMGFYVPGEIRTLCEIAKPHVGVLTNIGTVHAERAGSQEIIAQGKAELVESLPLAPEGIAILNKDDPWVRTMASKTGAKTFFYSVEQDADLKAVNINSLGIKGITLELLYEAKAHKVQSPLMGEFSAYTILRAAAVALNEGLTWDEIKEGIAAGQIDIRMRQFSLSNGVIILDDTYNASPASTIAALKLLSKLEGQKIAVLGDMLELGPYEESGHYDVGLSAAAAADILILVGERSKITAQAALDSGYAKKNIFWHESSDEAINTVLEKIQNGDVVLVKGSNSMRMDRIISALEASS